MSVFDEFGSWKQFLSNRLEQAESHGMSDKAIQKVAHEIGDYLAQNVAAPNKEAAAIQELWNVADHDEQQALTNVMIKLVKEE